MGRGVWNIFHGVGGGGVGGGARDIFNIHMLEVAVGFHVIISENWLSSRTGRIRGKIPSQKCVMFGMKGERSVLIVTLTHPQHAPAVASMVIYRHWRTSTATPQGGVGVEG